MADQQSLFHVALSFASTCLFPVGMPGIRVFEPVVRPPVGTVIQEGKGYKEVVIGRDWVLIEWYVGLTIRANVTGEVTECEGARPFEVAYGFVVPFTDGIGSNKKRATGITSIEAGGFTGKVHARSLDGLPMAIGYSAYGVKVPDGWHTPPLNF